jgi:broad specificity phosphatase PhoE
MPERVQGVPSEHWRLGDEGRAAARELAQRLAGELRIVSSSEPKALETAEELIAVRGGSVTVDERLGEVRRPPRWDGGYYDRARRYVGGEPVDGWEPLAEIVERFAAAARGAEVVVTHGLAMTLYLAADDPVRFWDELAFPDAWSALAGKLRRVH